MQTPSLKQREGPLHGQPTQPRYSPWVRPPDRKAQGSAGHTYEEELRPP
ncbi:hypothetical protein EI555_007546, partial [Monodon monoceros]